MNVCISTCFFKIRKILKISNTYLSIFQNFDITSIVLCNLCVIMRRHHFILLNICNIYTTSNVKLFC